MRAARLLGIMGLSVLVAGGGCSSDDDEGNGADGGTAGAAGSSGTDGGAATGGTTTGGSSGAGVGGSATGGTAGGGPCQVTSCQGHTYLCGNCLDDDGDGKIDVNDPDCLNPCHNTEEGFHPCIPGLNNAPCTLDCYYDQDSGAGNDQCYWDHRCDTLEKAPDYPPQGPGCEYTGGKPPAMPDTCDALYAKQADACLTFCGALTPNGCDCFGCCELPAGSGSFVWLGSTSDNSGKCELSTCGIGDEGDPAKCHPCTPVQGGLNPCDKCEYCLGKQELPAECFDGGAGTGGTGGCPPDPVCDGGKTPCDYVDGCLPPCPAGNFCLTGCCTPIG
jgi:hypothetical protein